MTDNGSGFTDVVLKQWGAPFVTTKAQGTGLGLYNALTLAQPLGGHLKVIPQKDGGGCVEFCLPTLEFSANVYHTTQLGGSI